MRDARPRRAGGGTGGVRDARPRRRQDEGEENGRRCADALERGRRPPGLDGPATGVAAFLPGRRCPRPPHGGSPGTGAQPFDWGASLLRGPLRPALRLEPGAQRRCIQGDTIGRGLPPRSGGGLASNKGQLAPMTGSAPHLPASARAISNSDICPVFLREDLPGEDAFRRDFALSSGTREAFPRAS
jgi:hypothetical protein